MKSKPKHWLDNVVPMIRFVAQAIEAEKDVINELNEFPVPDGDTGTNIANTLARVSRDVSRLPKNVPPSQIIDQVMESAKKGARGNSGTILAAMIEGGGKVLRDADEMSVELLTEALIAADLRAREVLQTPVEGTMLTVIRAMANAGSKAVEDGITSVPEASKLILAAGVHATNETPKMLAKLKNKVDSGAYALRVMTQASVSFAFEKALDWAKIEIEPIDVVYAEDSSQTHHDNHNWEPGTPLYCTEFLWYFAEGFVFDHDAVIAFLSSMGDSVQLLADDTFAKVHVHTNSSWEVLEYFGTRGELAEVEVHNMRIQTEERNLDSLNQEPPKPLGVVVVASGEGMKDLMFKLGADAVIDGGQTANPDAETIANAADSVNAEVVVVLPSNRNILATAKLALSLTKRDCRVVSTTNMPQSVQALTALANSDSDVESAIEQMKAATEAPFIRSAAITKATRNYEKGDFIAKPGQLITISEEDKVAPINHSNFESAVIDTVDYLVGDAPVNLVEIVTVYKGEYLKSSPDDWLVKLNRHLHPETELHVVESWQPVYSVIIEVQIADC